MIRYKKNCKVCTEIRRNERLKTRIYKSTWFIPDGYETISDIANDTSHLWSKASLYNHVRKHQIIQTGQRTREVMSAIIEQEQKREDLLEETEIVKGVESPLIVAPLQPKATFEDVWDEVVEIGHDQLKKGNMKVTANVLLKAAADKANYESKKQDRQLAFMQMIAHFASGESTDGRTSSAS